MKNLSKILATSLLAFAFVPAVSAQDFQASGGVGYTYAPQIEDFGSLSGTGRLGIFFHENFGVEGEATFGLGEADLNSFTVGETELFDGDLTMSLDSQVAGFLVGRMKGGPTSEYFARIGYGTAKTSIVDTAFNEEVNVEFSGFAYGFGGTYFFNKNSGLRLDLTSISSGSIDFEAGGVSGELDVVDQDGDDLNTPFTTLSVSYVYKFN